MKKLPLVLSLVLSCLAGARPAASGAARVRRPAATGGKTLDECFAAALERSEVVATQQELIKQAEEAYHQAVGSVLPTVSAVGAYQFQESAPSGGNLSTIYPNPSTLTKLTVTQPLFQGFKEFAGLSLTKSLVQASVLDKKQAAALLYRDTAGSFFSVLSLENEIDDIQEELDYYDQRLRELKQFRAIGRSRLSEELTAQSQQAGLAAQMKLMRGQLGAQRAVLSFLTGFAPTTPLARPTAEGDATKGLDAYLEGIQRRPDVLAETQRVKAAEEGIPVARAGHFPTVGLQGDYYLERTGALRDVHWDVLLAVTVPIFSGGIVSAQVGQAVSRRDQAELQLTRIKRQAEQEIRQYFELYTGTRDQFETYRSALELSEKTYKEELREYRLGLVTNLDVLQALTTFQETQRSFDRARYAMLQDREWLEAAAGIKPVTTGGARPN